MAANPVSNPVSTDEKAPAEAGAVEDPEVLVAQRAEAEGLEPPSACARRISRADQPTTGKPAPTPTEPESEVAARAPGQCAEPATTADPAQPVSNPVSSEQGAGRLLDSIVAERVMGITWDESRCRVCGWPLVPAGEHGCRAGDCSMRPSPVPHADAPRPYSTDIKAAWQVVEHLRGQSVYIDVETTRDGFFAIVGWEGEPGNDIWIQEFAGAETAPLAICRAALMAVEARARREEDAHG